jgi:hypothetical protein
MKGGTGRYFCLNGWGGWWWGLFDMWSLSLPVFWMARCESIATLAAVFNPGVGHTALILILSSMVKV